MANEGQSTQHGLMGMYVLKDNHGCQVYRPTWNGTRTIIRPFPGRNPENPTEWDPFRLSDQPRDYGDWIRRYDMSVSLGNPGITFIIKDPMDHLADEQQNPVWMLHRAITQAIKNGVGLPSWPPLTMGAAGRSAPLDRPKDGYLLQGILMEHKSQVQDPPRGVQMDHKPVVMLLSQSAGNALLSKLEECNSEGGFRYSNLVDLDTGLYIQFHQAGTQRANAGPRTMSMTGGGGRAADNMKYEVEILEDYNGILPTFDGIHDLAAAHVRAWDDIIRIPTYEEQVGLLCNAGLPESAIVYALGDVYGEIIPQHVHEKARAQMGGAGPVVGAVNTTAPMQRPAAGGAANPMQRRAPVAPPPPPPAEEAPFDVPEETPAPAPVAEQAAAPAQAFDAQPTHAEPGRTAQTAAALARARGRAKQQQS
jgi:hypothetical protein